MREIPAWEWNEDCRNYFREFRLVFWRWFPMENETAARGCWTVIYEMVGDELMHLRVMEEFQSLIRL